MNKLKKTLVGVVAAVAVGAGGTAIVAAPAFAVLDYITPVKGNGPGLKNWHCHDYSRNWYGPWRYTKSGAQVDCLDYIAGSGNV